jgi:hypothetical protein
VTLSAYRQRLAGVFVLWGSKMHPPKSFHFFPQRVNIRPHSNARNSSYFMRLLHNSLDTRGLGSDAAGKHDKAARLSDDQNAAKPFRRNAYKKQGRVTQPILAAL